MRTIIKSLIILLFAGSISACNRYEDYNNQRRAFYLTQRRNPDLIGVWGTGSITIQYMEYRNDGKIYRYLSDYATNTIKEFPEFYWYTDDTTIYRLEIYNGKGSGNARKLIEDLIPYHFSENKDTLFLQGYGAWFRTTLPE